MSETGARGIALPSKEINGRFKIVGGDDYVDQLVSTMLGDGDSDNPFQDLGLGEFMIFAINSESIDGEIKKRVERGFASLKKDQLAQLQKGSRSLKFVQNGGDRVMYLEYQNLETGERRSIEVPLPPAGE